MLSTKLITRATIRINSHQALVQNRNIGTPGGIADKVTGAIKEKLGWATGNEKMQSEGSAENSRGDAEIDMAKTENTFNNNQNKSSNQYSSGSQMKSGGSSNDSQSGSEGKSQSGAWNPTTSNSGGGWNKSKGQTEGWNASGQPEAMQSANGQEATKEMKGQADGLRDQTRGLADGWNHTKGQESWNSQTKGPSDAWSNTIGMDNKESSQSWDKSKGSEPGLQNKGSTDATFGKTDRKTSVNIGSEDALSRMKADNKGSSKNNNEMGGSINENILRNQSVGTDDLTSNKATSDARKNQSDLMRDAGKMTMNKSHEYQGATDKDGKGKGVKNSKDE